MPRPAEIVVRVKAASSTVERYITVRWFYTCPILRCLLILLSQVSGPPIIDNNHGTFPSRALMCRNEQAFAERQDVLRGHAAGGEVD